MASSSILPRGPLLHRSQLRRLLKRRRAISSEINPLSQGISRAVARAGRELVFGMEDIPDFGGVGTEEDAGACGLDIRNGVCSVIFKRESGEAAMVLAYPL